MVWLWNGRGVGRPVGKSWHLRATIRLLLTHCVNTKWCRPRHRFVNRSWLWVSSRVMKLVTWHTLTPLDSWLGLKTHASHITCLTHNTMSMSLAKSWLNVVALCKRRHPKVTADATFSSFFSFSFLLHFPPEICIDFSSFPPWKQARWADMQNCLG